MSEWLKAYEAMPPESQANIQRWIHLNKFIARTLNIPEQAWFEDYVGAAMQRGIDYSFMFETVPGFLGLELPGQGETFSRTVDPAEAAAGPKVPIGAQNNLGRLSPALQEAIAKAIESGDQMTMKLVLQDVAALQKIFPSAKDLAKLKRPDFRRAVLRYDVADGDFVINLDNDKGPALLRVHRMEMGVVMGRMIK